MEILRDTRTDVYDVARAIVSAFSWRYESSLVPVSTLAVKHELHRRCCEESTITVLEHLSEIRDLQRLDRGYWLPAPTHLVTCDEFSMVVSGLSTQELTRSMDIDPRHVGLGRTISTEKAAMANLPAISLADWMDAPTSTSKWTDAVIKSAKFGMPIGVDNFDVFRHWRDNVKGRWLKLVDSLTVCEGIVLARHRSRDYRSNYYLLQIRDSCVKAMHELPPGFDIPRLMCGLRSNHDDALACRIRHEGDASTSVLRVGIVPAAERRLLRAIGLFRDTEEGHMVEALVPTFALKCVTRVFEALGCAIERRIDD